MPTMTISGLASGLDTDEIIQKLMEIERQPVKRLQQRKAELGVDKNAWRDIGTRLSNLLSALTSLKLQSTFTAKMATSSDPKALTATASADAAVGTYKIWIKQLAQAHKVASDRPKIYATPTDIIPWDTFDDLSKTDTYATITNLVQAVDSTTGDKALTLEGSSLSGSLETDELSFDAPKGGRLSLTVKHREAANVTYRYEYRYYNETTGSWSSWLDFPSSPMTYSSDGSFVTYNLVADIKDPISKVQVRATIQRPNSVPVPLFTEWTLKGEALQEVVDAATPLGLQGRFRISVGSTSFEVTVATGDSLNAIKEAINTAAANVVAGTGKTPPVTATVIDLRLIITSNTLGESGRITFADLEGTVLQNLGIIDANGNIKPGAEVTPPQDAQLKVDNIPSTGYITRATNTINDVIPGVTLNLLAVTDTANPDVVDPNEEITLEITKNTQAAVDAVQKFIDQYNSAMDFIASKLGKTATGEPGDLFGDPTLARIQQELRRLVFDKVNLAGTKYTSAGSVGISTGAVSTSGLTFDRSGKLTLDVAEFTKALGEDPKGVAELFTYNKDGVAGIAVRLDDYLKRITKASLGTTPSAGDGVISTKQKWIDLQIEDIEKQIARWEDRLALREEQLRRQFTAMESMLGALQNQATWLAGQIASLQSLNLARTQK